MRHRTRVYPSSAISLSKSATADLDAQARNPYSRWWLWIPGSRFARLGMTASAAGVLFVGADAEVFRQRRRHRGHLLAVGDARNRDAGVVEDGLDTRRLCTE